MRLVPWRWLAAALVLYVALNALLVFVLLPAKAFAAIAQVSGGLVSSTLVANALLLVGVVGLLCWRGGLKVGDLGLRAAGIGSALGVAVVLWLGINLLQAACAVIARVPLAIHPDWATAGPARTAGAFLAQLFGNALFEEVFFRGVLFQQTRLRLLVIGAPPRRALWLALLLSQSIFAAIHLPLRISAGVAWSALPAELALLFALGVLLALLYWRTGNLWLVIAVHALSNEPLLLVQRQVDGSTNGAIAAVASITLLLLWPRAWRPSRGAVSGRASRAPNRR